VGYSRLINAYMNREFSDIMGVTGGDGGLRRERRREGVA
jgi:hypothetical protein